MLFRQVMKRLSLAILLLLPGQSFFEKLPGDSRFGQFQSASFYFQLVCQLLRKLDGQSAHALKYYHSVNVATPMPCARSPHLDELILVEQRAAEGGEAVLLDEGDGA